MQKSFSVALLLVCCVAKISQSQEYSVNLKNSLDEPVSVLLLRQGATKFESLSFNRRETKPFTPQQGQYFVAFKFPNRRLDYGHVDIQKFASLYQQDPELVAKGKPKLLVGTRVIVENYTVSVPVTKTVVQTYQVNVPYVVEIPQQFVVQLPDGSQETRTKVVKVTKLRTETRSRNVPVTSTVLETRTKQIPKTGLLVEIGGKQEFVDEFIRAREQTPSVLP